MLDEWRKGVAPSSALRKLYHAGNIAWDDFVDVYTSELNQCQVHWQPLLDRVHDQVVTLLYARKDEQHNHANVLREFLRTKS